MKDLNVQLPVVWNLETLKKSNSPFSIYFYLKKCNEDYDSARVLYENFLSKNSPFRKKQNRPNCVEYWIAKGYDKDESNLKVKEFQSHPLDLEEYKNRYGQEEGIKKYNLRKENYQSRFDVEIQNIQKKLDCDYDAAYEFVCNKRRKCSPRTIDYWMEKGYSVEDSRILVSKYQKENSPRSIYYWVKIGYTEQDAQIKVREYQDNLSINSIMKRYSCDKLSALELQESFLEKIKFTRIQKGLDLDPSLDYEYFVYKKAVQKETKKSLRLNKDILVKKNKKDSLDHRYSIFKGFLNDVPSEVIGSIYNLEYISISKNSKKQINCSIDLQTLMEKYKNGN